MKVTLQKQKLNLIAAFLGLASIQLTAQEYTFETSGDTETFKGVSGGTSITQTTVDGRGVIQWNHANKGQPTFDGTTNITASTNTHVKIVFQNNSNANHIRIKNATATPWVGQVGNINANSSAWQTLIMDVSSLDSYGTDADYELRYQFRIGNTALSGDIFIDEISFGTPATLSINNNSLVAKGIQLYPNPVENELRIKAKSNIKKIEILNVLGEKVLSKENNNALNIETLNNGVYFAKITLEKNLITTKRFIKK
ncbi:hypothetical protein GCM10022291_06920 [Postechiella marina]|uniref:Secretion system C-terminal sorting domain-containing protein n=1 Tax=Postechiella marina TaxID=943941 RepID=A0ABP8C224_9FLAO